MSYIICDVNGYVSELANIHTYALAIKFIDSFAGVAPLKNFIDEGKTEDMEGTLKALNSIMPYATDEAVKLTLNNMKEGLEKSKEVAIISQ
jgi:hypothetical protein